MSFSKRVSKNQDIANKNNNAISNVFNEYCSKTSVHGISYLGDRDKNICEKFLWVIIFLICVIVCSVQIIHTWTKWKENPVIIRISEAQVPISSIPFPAVTICPFNKIDHRKYNYREIYIKRYLPELIDKKFLDVSLLCNEQTLNYTYMTDEDAIKHIYEVAPRFETHTVLPKLNGEVIKFYNQITEDGLCYTYNSFNQNDMYTNKLNPELKLIEDGYDNEGWDIENGYPENTETYRVYPNRSREGVKQGMQLILFTYRISRNLACGEPVIGYKISLHNPSESPQTGQQYVLTPIKKLTVISVKPIIMTTSKSLQNLDANRRNCYFSYEKSLRFFKIYTQKNCKSECITNVTQVYCGCVGFYMPRDNNTKICGTMDCINKLESGNFIFCIIYEFGQKNNDCTLIEVLAEFDVIKSHKNLQKEKSSAYKIYNECDCKQACASLDYEYDSSQADYDWEEGFKNKHDILRAQIPLNWHEFTSVNIFFKESQFMALQRKELIDETDFLASCGGLLGIFMGVSFVSLIEIIYFVTVRLWCKLKFKEKKVNE